MRADGLPEPDDSTDILSALKSLPIEGALCRACRRIRPLVDSIATPYCLECVRELQQRQAAEMPPEA